MFRDDRNAMLQQNEALAREAGNLRADNAAMRAELLALRRANAMVPGAPDVYRTDVAYLTPGERAALSYHQLQQFPVWAVALLNVFTLGLFPLIHFGMHHDKLPQATPSDPSAGKAIGFSFIPYFNLYWVFFNSLRLCDRINLQFRLRGLPEEAPKGLMIACSVMSVIPYVNFLIGIPLMWTIGTIFLQSAINKAALLGPMVDGGPTPPQDPYARPPAGLIGA